MDLRPELAGRGTAGRAGLQGMTAFERAATSFAAADMHVETTIDHRPRNFGLILHGDVRLVDSHTGAVRTALGHWRVVGFVDAWRHAAMGVRTMSLARLATGRLGLGGWRAFREWRRLAFATPSFFFQRRHELGYLLPQGLHLKPQLGTPWTIALRLFRIHDRGDYHGHP